MLRVFQMMILNFCMPVYLLADFSPGLFQPVYGTAIESRCDLQHAVIVVEAATDICNCQPFLNWVGPGAHLCVGHDLRCHQITHLREREWILAERGQSNLFARFKSLIYFLCLLTSLKCWLVFMMYGVLSILSTFIHPWPRNSLMEATGIL